MYDKHIEHWIVRRAGRKTVETIEVVDGATIAKGLERYVRPKDVIASTSLSKATVMAALRSGELKGIRYGRAWLIPVSAVKEWLGGGGQQER